MVAIIGSGFGLYGYLPALLKRCTERVLLSKRYISSFSNRCELARFYSNIVWAEDETEVLCRATSLVLAIRPTDQPDWVARCLEGTSVQRLLLEKPLASCPESATSLYGKLLDSKRFFRIGYIFRYTRWAACLAGILKSGVAITSVSIKWHFLAHHYKNKLEVWKRYNSSGGGVIRFYGIHLIALLAEFGYRSVHESCAVGCSSNETYRWSASFSGNDLPDFFVDLNLISEGSEFSVKVDDDFVVSGPDPFAQAARDGDIDPRADVLARLCDTLLEDTVTAPVWYGATLDLWSLVEQITRFQTDMK
jgi:predicted dehydrogenase